MKSLRGSLCLHRLAHRLTGDPNYKSSTEIDEEKLFTWDMYYLCVCFFAYKKKYRFFFLNHTTTTLSSTKLQMISLLFPLFLISLNAFLHCAEQLDRALRSNLCKLLSLYRENCELLDYCSIRIRVSASRARYGDGCSTRSSV